MGRPLTSMLISSLVLASPTAAQQSDVRQAPRQVTLGEAIEVAIRNNPSLEQSRAGVDLAASGRLNAYGSFLPSLNVGSDYSTSNTGRLDPTGSAIVQTSYTAQLRANYVIFDGLRRFSDLRAARRGVEAEQAAYREREYQTVLNVKTAFYNAVANRELVRVEEDRVRRQRDQLEFVRQQLSYGLATRSDVLRSQVDLNNARLAVLNAENAARASTFALAEAMGAMEPVAPSTEATLEVEPVPYDRADLIRIAEQSGPSVVAARAAAEAADAEVGAARSSYWPSLNFSGGFFWRNDEFPPKDRTWSLSLSASYPLFNGLQRETNLIRARAQAEIADAQQRVAQLTLRSDVDDALGQVETSIAGIALAEQNVELSREDLRVTRERYRLGVATILDLQTAQIAVRQAEVDLIRRRFDYQIGVARLEALLGQELTE